MRRLAPVVFVLALAIAACSEGGGGGETAEGGAGGTDTRFHPPPSGVRISEAEACSRLQSAFQARAGALSCIKTVRGCPSFVRAVYQPECMEYDEGSVDGCAEYYAGIGSCDELDDSSCVVTTYPGSEPAGCP